MARAGPRDHRPRPIAFFTAILPHIHERLLWAASFDEVRTRKERYVKKMVPKF